MANGFTSRTKAILDVTVTVLMGVAAMALIWRTWAGPADSSPRQRPTAPAFEDLASSDLTTSVVDAPRVGDEGASVFLIEYSDFECPFCARHASETFQSIDEDFIQRRRLTYVLRNYPIEQIHPSATKAAQVAGCAEQQGQFLAMRRFLFANQRALAGVDWATAAADLDLDRARFQSCLIDSDVAQIRAEKQEAERLGVVSTPTFLIGTRSGDRVQIVSRLTGAAPYAVFKDRLDRMIASVGDALVRKL